MEHKIHLYFSILMSLFMVFVMSLVVSIINIGFTSYLIQSWLKSAFVAWFIAFPLIYFFAPIIKNFIVKKLQK